MTLVQYPMINFKERIHYLNYLNLNNNYHNYKIFDEN